MRTSADSNRYSTEVTHNSWFSRLRASFGGMCAGLLLLIASFPVLVLNERRTVRRYQALVEGEKVTVSISDSSAAVDPSNEGRLVHLTGTTAPGSNVDLSDPIFGVRPQGLASTLKLKRAVEMYQWVEESHSETRKTKGGGTETETTYSYSRSWESSEVRSDNFYDSGGHENPGRMPFSPFEAVADPVTVGAFTLPPAMVGMISWYGPLGYSVSLDTILDETVRSEATVYGDGFYLSYGGGMPSTPAVGDARVTFDAVRTGPVSVLARQNGSTLAPYATKSGGGSIFILQRGAVTTDEMFRMAHAENTLVAWLLRLLGFFLMFCGLSAIAQPLSVAVDVIPCIGPAVGDLVSCGTGLAAFLLSLVLSSVVVALAWIAYRPLWAIGVLTTSGGLAFFLWRRSKDKARMEGYTNTNTNDILPVAQRIGEHDPVFASVVAQPVGTSYDDDIVAIPIPK